jgi:microcystin-dependent protein
VAKPRSMQRTRTLLAGIVAVCLIGVVVPAAAGAGVLRQTGLPAGKSLLFSLQAERGTLRREPGTKDRFVLSLGGLPSQAVWFTDRPARQSGAIRLGRFLGAWSGLGFRGDPPNAVLALTGGKEKADTLAVELGKPRYSPRSGVVTFRVRTLRSLRAGLAHLGPRLDKALPARFDDAALFIDDATLGDSGSTCDSLGQLDILASFLVDEIEGYRVADGGILSQASNPLLFKLIGTTFGSVPNGFAIPSVAGPGPGLAYGLCTGGPWRLNSLNDYEGDATCAVGQLSLFAQDYAYVGWVPADGRSLETDRSPLGDLIGTTFGGDGENFNVPSIPGPPGLKYSICAGGVTYPGNGGEGPGAPCVLGQISLFAGQGFAMPANYIPAAGQLLPINQQTALFSLFNTSYGGNGETTFALPTLQSPYPGTTYGVCLQGVYPPR